MRLRPRKAGPTEEPLAAPGHAPTRADLQARFTWPIEEGGDVASGTQEMAGPTLIRRKPVISVSSGPENTGIDTLLAGKWAKIGHV